MIKKQFVVFLFRWLVSSVTMWLCINSFGSVDAGYNSFWLYPTAGLVMSLVNAIVKPIATIFSLPLIILSMGLFTLILNILMIALVVWIVPHVHMTTVGVFLSWILMSLINSLVNFLVPSYN
ncbi:MAG: phage holin family protein [Candidatus Nanosyncoccus sp.]